MGLAFPPSTLKLCTKHLKDNLSRFLSEKIGMELNKIFRIKNKSFHILLGSNTIGEFMNSLNFLSTSLLMETLN